MQSYSDILALFDTAENVKSRQKSSGIKSWEKNLGHLQE